MSEPNGVRWRDAVLPVGIAIAAVLELVLMQTGTWQIAALIEVVACGLLVWRRRWPLATCVIAPLALFTIPWLGGRLDDASVPIAAVVLASFSLGRYPRTVGHGLVGVGLVAAGIGLTYAVADPRVHSWGDVVFLCGLFVPPFVLGRVVARMAAQKALLIEQQAWIEREAATGERVRIARELHDVLAHSISAMVVQSEVAHQLVRADPDGALAALDAVTASGRAALDETGRVLHTLRVEERQARAVNPVTAGAPAPPQVPAPAPGLAEVPKLVDELRARGLHIDAELAARHAASGAVDVSAYRIVQEALTNALRHGDGSATLRIAAETGRLTIHVDNGVGERPRPGGGLGLTGMAERVSLCGGQIRHGIGPDGRFVVDVTLPLAAYFPAQQATGDRRAGMTSVAIVDDQNLIRSGLSSLLTLRGVDVVGEAADGRRGLELVTEARPDVVLMDIRMPRLDGIAATREIVRRRLTTRVLVVTTYDLDEYVYGALRAGAAGFLLKSIAPERLVEGIETVARGEALLAPALTRRLIEEYVQRPPPGSGVPQALATLTSREVDVLRHMASGLSNGEVADQLVVSEATVKTHVNRLFAKLGLQSRAQAVVVAYECGLVVPGNPAVPAPRRYAAELPVMPNVRNTTHLA